MIRKLDLVVEQISLSQIKPYDGNAKIHTNEQLDAVEASIKEFGFANPVLLWHNEDGIPEIVAGHARCKAAQNLGMDEVPAIFLDSLSDAQRRALALVDNQTTMMTGWDMDQLSYELDTLADEFDMGDFGFDLDDMDDPVQGIEDEGSEEALEAVSPIYEPKPGVIWEAEDLWSFDESEYGFIDEIEDAEIRQMLRVRAAWFADFNYSRVADYYVNQANEKERLAFEKLALVILDRGQMIENGFSDIQLAIDELTE